MMVAEGVAEADSNYLNNVLIAALQALADEFDYLDMLEVVVAA